MDKVNHRNITLRIIEDIYGGHLFITDALEKHIKGLELDKQSRAFINRLVNGTIENTLLLDYIINQFSKTKTAKMKPVILNILRLSVYQLLYMDSVPNSAACNEGVKLAKKRKIHQLSGFVNGVLRNISRNIDNIKYPLESNDPNKYLSIMTSTPKWLVDKLVEQYSYERIKEVLFSAIGESMITIRHNPIKCSLEELKESLDRDNTAYEVGELLPYALKLKNINQIAKLEAYKKGYFQVQDESSMLVAEVIEPGADQCIIDLCSAPGGKTTHIAQKLNNKGLVIARDISAKKLIKIKENCDRLGLVNVNISAADATIIDEELIGKGDAVLADVPCSGLGIINKKPDIKLNVEENKIENLIKIQRKIFENAASYVKKGGILVYSTCTINKDENESNITWFLDKNDDFELQEIAIKIDDNRTIDHHEYISLMPKKEGHDGFFIAKLRRV